MNDRNEISRGFPNGIPVVYLSLLTLLLSLAWLLPNHNHPWTSFHSEAWISLIFGILAIWIFLLAPKKIIIPSLGLLFLATASIPLIQHISGMIYSSGDAWLQSIYLAGFAMTIVLGRQWQLLAPEQANGFLFSAFIIAGITSVGIAILQISQYSSLWIMPLTSGRAFANLSQPNHLASLLLLALVGVYWWNQERKLHPALGTGISVILLSGLALTQSRTGWLNLTLITLLLFINPPKSTASRWRLTLVALIIYFICAALLSPTVISILTGTTSSGRNFSDPTRIELWSSAIEAIGMRPWFGWGWGKAYSALLAGDFVSIAGVAKHSHNIVLDLMLYNGIPLGLTIVGFFFVSMARKFTSPLESDYKNLPPLLAIVILLLHAMLELPLHSAYFLFPAGLLIGVLSLSTLSAVSFPRGLLLLLTSALVAALLLLARDYLEIEQHFRNIGYPVGHTQSYQPPPMQILKQWEDQLWFANTPPAPIKDNDELRRIENIILSGAPPILQMKLAHHLVLSNNLQRASYWLDQICKKMQPTVTIPMLNYWKMLGQTDSRFLAVSPSSCSAP